ncbi:MAG TPA: alpha-(1-_3)-arabinofuranosyltransferase family protein, partial [Streptosporangiaceae bacterium]|nr:alpha-(1->3)-arabinofuranosyltransferase family protein [Streptosporangiaceae bacterium]
MTEPLERVSSGAGPPAQEVDERVRSRIRLLAFSLLLMVLPFVTAPGRIIADTKLDLAVNPAAFLARALTLWDPQQFGILQNQAAGYLFPMGPFFWLGKLAALQPWVIQRLWIGVVAVAAFLGIVRLAGRLGIGTPWARIAAGFAYAASPAGLPVIGALSNEFLPAAMLPWILLPLVDAARGGRRGIAAARSATAIGLCGAVNATATIAVLVPAVLYVLTLARPAPRWRILAWWCPAAVAATLWWSVPLVLLYHYGVSWLPYTESAAVTTSVTGLSQILRGAENWVSYLVVYGQPWWQLGYRLVTGALPILLSGLVAGLGLAGLVRPRLPGRRFLICLLLTGVVIIAAGHVSSLGNPFAGPVDHLINGAASPLRNLRKFDPLVRLPVAMGLAHLL